MTKSTPSTGEALPAGHLRYTLFTNLYATQKKEQTTTWPDLVQTIRNAGPFPEKAACPWLKLATFGDKASPKGSYRTNDNMAAVYGVEADYDAGLMPLAEARALLEKNGIRAALYTSASHLADKPRWRVLAPLSRAHAPSDRDALVARINGALGGVLAAESFTRSQAYYFGQVAGRAYEVTTTFNDPVAGQCVDLLQELDSIAIGKPHAMDGSAAASGVDAFASRVSELGRKLATGDGRRDMVKHYVAGLARFRVGAAEIMYALEGVERDYFDETDPFDRDNIKRIVDDMVIQHATSGLPDLNPTAQGALVPVSLGDVWTAPSPPQRHAWGACVPLDHVTLLGGHGGTGKSTLALQLCAHVAAGKSFLGLPATSGRAVFFSAEDCAEVIRRRFATLCQSEGLEPASVAQRLTVLDATTAPILYQELSDRSGKRGGLTEVYNELRSLLEPEGVALLVIDNASDAFDASETERARVREFVRSLATLGRDFGCAVVLLVHVAKATAKASYSVDEENYSGSTAWHNSARSRLFLAKETAGGNHTGALCLRHEKHNLGPLQAPMMLAFKPDGTLALHESLFTKVDATETDTTHQTALLRLIHEAAQRGESVSPNVNAPKTTAYGLFHRDKGFPRDLDRHGCTSALREAHRAGWLRVETYKTPDRKQRERWTLTAEGLALVAGESENCDDLFG